MPELKSFPFPVWSSDSADYEKGRYEANIKPRLQGSNVVTIRHAFHEGGLIGEMLNNRQAVFGCIVSLPSTMYRRVFVEGPEDVCEQTVVCEQPIPYDDSGYGQVTAAVESPMFRPIILAREDVTKKVNAATDGLIPLWEGAEITIHKGSVIAYGEWERFGGSRGGMLVVELDRELGDWQMSVADDTSAGFRFILYVGEELYHSIKSPASNDAGQRGSVLTHAVSAALSLLKEKYKDDTEAYDDYLNLRLFAALLRENELGDWRDKDFRPERAASALYPHKFPRNDEDG